MDNILNTDFVNESLDAQVILDIESNKFIMCNQNVFKIYGYTQEEFLNITPYDLSVDFLNKYQMEKKQEDIINKGYDKFITKHKTKNGEILDIYIKSKKLNIKNGHFLFITLINLADEVELQNYYNDKLKSEQNHFIELYKIYQWNSSTTTLLKNGIVVNLSNTEKNLLSILINNINSTVSKEFIYQNLSTKITYNSLLSTIKRIRKKTSHDFIITIYSSGYQINY